MKIKRRDLMLFSLLSLLSVGTIAVSVGVTSGLGNDLVSQVDAIENFPCSILWNSAVEITPTDGGFRSIAKHVQLAYGNQVTQNETNHAVLKYGDANQNYIATSGIPFSTSIGYGGEVNGLNSITVKFDNTVADLIVETWNSSNPGIKGPVIHIKDSEKAYNVGFTKENLRPNQFRIIREELETPNTNDLNIESFSINCTAISKNVAGHNIDVYSEQDLISAVSADNFNDTWKVIVKNDIKLTKPLKIRKNIEKLQGDDVTISAAYDFGKDGSPLIDVDLNGDTKNIKFYTGLTIDGTGFSGGLVKIRNSQLATQNINYIITSTNPYGIFVDKLAKLSTWNSFPLYKNAYIDPNCKPLNEPEQFKKGIEVGSGGVFINEYSVNSVYVHANGYVYDKSNSYNDKRIENLFLENKGQDTEKGVANYGVYETYYSKSKPRPEFLHGFRNTIDGKMEPLVKFSQIPEAGSQRAILRGCNNTFDPSVNIIESVNDKFNTIYKFEPYVIRTTPGHMDLSDEFSNVFNVGKFVVNSGVTTFDKTIVIDGATVIVEGQENFSGRLVCNNTNPNDEMYGIKAINGANVIINNLNIDGGKDAKINYAISAVGADTKVTINDGKYSTGHKAVMDESSVCYVSDDANITINDGYFFQTGKPLIPGEDQSPVLNVDDAKPGKFNVIKGNFENFNPANPCAEAVSALNPDGTTRYIKEAFIEPGRVAYAQKIYDQTGNDLINLYRVGHSQNIINDEILSDGTYNYSVIDLTGNLFIRIASGDEKNLNSVIEFHQDKMVNLNGATIGFAYERPDAVIKGTHALISIMDNADVTISGGTLDATLTNGTNAYAVNVVNGNDTDPETNTELTLWNGNYIGMATAIQVQSGALLIEDGNFKVNSDDKRYVVNCIDKNYNSTAFIQVRGGTFDGFDPSNITNEPNGTTYVTEGHKISYNKENNSYTVYKPLDYGTTKMSVREFERLLAKTDGTFKLENDIALYASSGDARYLTTYIIISNENLTIDLAGHKIYFADAPAADSVGVPTMFTINGNANVTIADSVGGGMIDATYGDSAAYGFNINSVDACLTINGGTFIGAPSAIQVQYGLLTINGGRFTMTKGTPKEQAKYIINCVDANYKQGLAYILARGGTFDADISADPEGKGTSYLDRGYGIKANEDGTFTVEYVNNMNMVDPTTGEVVETKTMKQFESELNTTTGTYTLQHDIRLVAVDGESGSLNPYILLDNANLTIDLNGHKITVDHDETTNIKGVPCLFSLTRMSRLTIDDSSNGQGSIDATVGNNSFYIFNVMGEGCKLTINGGTFVGSPTVAQVQTGNLVINGGNFYLANAEANAEFAKYIINAIDANYKNGTAKVTIYGGTFGFDPSSKTEGTTYPSYVAEGYVSTDNLDGTWTVSQQIVTK